MLTRFFADREKVNAEVYCKVLEDKIIPWMKEKDAGKVFCVPTGLSPSPLGEEDCQLAQGVWCAVLG